MDRRMKCEYRERELLGCWGLDEACGDAQLVRYGLLSLTTFNATTRKPMREFIVIRNSGEKSMTMLNFCPFCGAGLKPEGEAD